MNGGAALTDVAPHFTFTLEQCRHVMREFQSCKPPRVGSTQSSVRSSVRVCSQHRYRYVLAMLMHLAVQMKPRL